MKFHFLFECNLINRIPGLSVQSLLVLFFRIFMVYSYMSKYLYLLNNIPQQVSN